MEVIDNSQEIARTKELTKKYNKLIEGKDSLIDSMSIDIKRMKADKVNEKRKKDKLDDIKNFTTDSATINAIDVAFANRSI